RQEAAPPLPPAVSPHRRFVHRVATVTLMGRRQPSGPELSPAWGGVLIVSKPDRSGLTRRDLLKTTGQVAAASALAGVVLPQVHAGEDSTIRVALIGCGGRGTGAAANALQARGGPTRLWAMADGFPERLASSHRHLRSPH